MQNFLGLPVQASTHAGEIDHLIILVHYLMFALFIGWGAFFVFVLTRFRKKANPRASYDGAKGKLSKGLEIAVVLVEAILLVGYAIPAWARRVTQLPAESEAIVARVVGHQFAWEVQYAGPDGKFGATRPELIASDNPLGLDKTDPNGKDDVITTNQLVLPIDHPALVHLSSQDVIHSFGVYELRVKQDAVPGLEFPVWFIPNRIGEYEITCSQLCGLGHYRMRGYVNIKSEADFQKWLADPNRS